MSGSSFSRSPLHGRHSRRNRAKCVWRIIGLTVAAAAVIAAEPMPASADICLEHATATLTGAEDLHIGTSLPATISFSNGEQIELDAAIMAEVLEIDSYTRPAETAAPTEGH